METVHEEATVHEKALVATDGKPDGTISINTAMRSMLEGPLNAVMDEWASELAYLDFPRALGLGEDHQRPGEDELRDQAPHEGRAGLPVLRLAGKDRERGALRPERRMSLVEELHRR